MTHRLQVLPRSSASLRPALSGNALEADYDFDQASHAPSFRPPAPSPSSSPRQNHLLAALPAADLERVSRQLELVPLPLGSMLYEPGRRMQYAYFPTTSVVSLHYLMESGVAAEAAGVGNEGVVGISLVMGGDTTPNSAVVQTAGYGYRIAGHLLKREFDRGGAMQRLLLRYTQALMAQMIQTAACIQHHLVEQQLCRFLLMTLDRVNAQKLHMTHELVGSLLGVRREGIGVAVARLLRAGVISWRRGHIEVLKRSGLEAHACECYSMMRAELNRLRSDTQSQRDPLISDKFILPVEEADAEPALPAQATLANWRQRGHGAHAETRQ